MKITINNGDSGLEARNSINSNFTELYNMALNYYKLTGVSANTSQVLPANSKVKSIYVNVTSGTPSINIGTTDGAGDIIVTTLLATGFNEFVINSYLSGQTTYYIDISGGTVSIGIETINSVF